MSCGHCLLMTFTSYDTQERTKQEMSVLRDELDIVSKKLKSKQDRYV